MVSSPPHTGLGGRLVLVGAEPSGAPPESGLGVAIRGLRPVSSGVPLAVWGGGVLRSRATAFPRRPGALALAF